MADRGVWQVAGKLFLLTVGLLSAALGAPPEAAAADLNALWPDLARLQDLPERVEYESNIFQAPSGAQDDVIFKTIPGFVLELPLGRHKIDLGFRAEILRYVDLESQDTEHYFVLGSLLLDFPGGLKFKLKEDFARTSAPPAPSWWGGARAPPTCCRRRSSTASPSATRSAGTTRGRRSHSTTPCSSSTVTST